MEHSRLRRRFFLLEGLFRLGWSVAVPCFYLYLTTLLQNESSAMIVVMAIYLILIVMEVTLGAIADLLRGTTMFYMACAFTGVGALMYALAIFLPSGDEHRLMLTMYLIASELVGGVGFSLISGSFERWYGTTLELVGVREKPVEIFAQLRTWRNVAGLVGGLIGIGFFHGFQSQFKQFSQDAAWYVLFIVPHFWAFVLRGVALAYAYLLRRSLDSHHAASPDEDTERPGMLAAGGSPLDMPSVRPSAAHGLASRVQQIRRTSQGTRLALRHGWRILLRSRPLQGAVYFASLYQLLLTFVTFLGPVLVLLVGFNDEGRGTVFSALLVGGFWTMTQTTRIIGSYQAKRITADNHLALILAPCFWALLAGGTIHVATSWISVVGGDYASLSLRFLLIFAPLAMLSYCLARLEPWIDSQIQIHSPPDLRSVIYSLRSMLSSVAVVFGLVAVHLMALWSGYGGRFDYSILFAVAGALSLVAALNGALGWRPQAAQDGWVERLKRQLVRRDPVSIVFGIALVVIIVVGVDHYLSDIVRRYRYVIGAGDYHVSLVLDGAEPMLVVIAQWIFTVLSALVFALLPGYTVIRWLESSRSAPRGSEDALVAALLVDGMHARVLNPMAAIANTLNVPDITRIQVDNAPIRLHTPAGVLPAGEPLGSQVLLVEASQVIAWVTTRRTQVNIQLAEMRRLTAKITENIDTEFRKQGCDLLEVLSKSLSGQSLSNPLPSDDETARLRWFKAQHGVNYRLHDIPSRRGSPFRHVRVALGVTDRRFDRALGHPQAFGPRHSVRITVDAEVVHALVGEAIHNAVAAVFAAHDEGWCDAEVDAAGWPPSVVVTVHVGTDSTWVLLSDLGKGIGPDPDVYERFGITATQGSGLGLYVSSCLHRAGMCHWTIADKRASAALSNRGRETPDTGTIVRIMFQGTETSEPEDGNVT